MKFKPLEGRSCFTPKTTHFHKRMHLFFDIVGDRQAESLCNMLEARFHGCSASMGEQFLESISFGEHHTAPLNRDDQLATGRSRVRRLKPLDEPEAVAASSNSRVLNRSSASKAAQRPKRPAAARVSTSKKRRANGVD